jgi:hypothetical protein
MLPSLSTHFARRGIAIGVALLVAAGVAVAPTPKAAAAEPTNVGVQESDGSTVTRSGTWVTVASGLDSGGKSIRASSSASASLRFTSDQIRVYARTNSYSGKMTVQIDGTTVRTVDLYSATQKNKVVVADIKGLSNAQHVVKISRAGSKNSASSGTDVFFDAFWVGATSKPTTSIPSSSATYQENSSYMTYRGPSWTSKTSSYDSGGSHRVSTNSPGAVSFAFKGTGVDWIARTNGYSGKAVVYIDGQSRGTIDLYSGGDLASQTVFSSRDLASGSHWITIEVLGAKNSSSTGSNVSFDAFKTYDKSAPYALGAPVSATKSGYVALNWIPSPVSDVAGYRVYRAQGDSGYQRIEEVSKNTISYEDAGQRLGTWYSYKVSAFDTSGNESPLSPGTAAKTTTLPATTPIRLSSCPTPTATVTTSAGLKNALANAAAGQSIRVASGNYQGNLALNVKATKEKPFWLCGASGAVITNGSPDKGTGIEVKDSSYARIAGLEISKSKKGISTDASSNISISDVELYDIGEEAVHFRSATTDSILANSRIARTGLLTSEFGEGVYIGSDPSNWCTYSNCEADRSNNNSVVDNVIVDTSAEAIEAKPGTAGGIIAGNSFSGGKLDSRYALSWVSVSGNGYFIYNNAGTATNLDGYRSVVIPDIVGSGQGNVFAQNSATLGNASGYGVFVTTKVGAIVTCDNTWSGGSGRTNVRCQGN